MIVVIHFFITAIQAEFLDPVIKPRYIASKMISNQLQPEIYAPDSLPRCLDINMPVLIHKLPPIPFPTLALL